MFQIVYFFVIIFILIIYLKKSKNTCLKLCIVYYIEWLFKYSLNERGEIILLSRYTDILCTV